MKHPLIEKIDFEIKDNDELSEFNAGLMQAKKSIKSVIEKHECEWIFETTNELFSNGNFKTGCGGLSGVLFKKSDDLNGFCPWCAGRISIPIINDDGEEIK